MDVQPQDQVEVSAVDASVSDSTNEGSPHENFVNKIHNFEKSHDL